MSTSPDPKGNLPIPSESPAVAIDKLTRSVSAADQHRLRSKWVMWGSRCQQSSKGSSSSKGQQEWDHHPITEFETIEQFWSLMNYLEEVKAEVFSHYVDVCFFREGIKPDWDDERNKDGGRIVLADSKCDNCETLFKYLIPISLLTIGHQFGEAADNVCGIFLSPLNKNPFNPRAPTTWSVAVWIDSNSVKKRHVISDRICEDLKLPPEVEMKWYLHAKRGKVFSNLRKTVDDTESASSATAPSQSSSSTSSSSPSVDSKKKDDTKPEDD